MTNASTLEVVLRIAQVAGAIGTIAVAIVAIVQLRNAVSTYQLSQNLQAAARIRRVVEKLTSDAHKLFTLVNDDVPTLTGASAIAKEFESRLGSSPTVQMFWNRLENQAFLHSVVVEGWESADHVSQLRDTIAEIQGTRDELYALSVLQHTAELLVILCRHSFSSAILLRRALRKNLLHSFLEPYGEWESVTDLVDRLNSFFVSQTYAFTGARDKDATIKTIGLLYIASEKILSLPDAKLLQLAKSKSPGLSFFGMDYDVAIEKALSEIEKAIKESTTDFLPESARSDLLAQVGDIKKHTSEEYIMDRMRQFNETLNNESRNELYLPSVSFSNPEEPVDDN